MATPLVFNNTTLYQPGAYSRVDTSALLVPALSSGSNLYFLGSARRGAPGRVLKFNNQLDALATFGHNTPLSVAIRLAFANGASFAGAVRLGRPTQATATLQGAGNPVPFAFTLTSADYGAYLNGNLAAQIFPDLKNVGKFVLSVSLGDPDTGRTVSETFPKLATTADIAPAIASSQLLGGVNVTTVGNLAAVAVVPFAGGSDGPPLVLADWAAGIGLLEFEPVNIVLAAGSTDPAVHALLLQHCALMSNTTNRKERTTIVGPALGETDAQVEARAQAFGSGRGQVLAMGIQAFDDFGVPTLYDGSCLAAAKAGITAFYGVAEPATHKPIQGILGLERNLKGTEKDDLIASGVCCPEYSNDKRIFRVVRDVTTWTQDATVEEYSVQRILDYVSVNVRNAVEDAQVGRGATVLGIPRIQSAATVTLNKLVSNGIITGWDSLTIRQEGTAFPTSYRVAPVFPTNWIPITEYFVPTL